MTSTIEDRLAVIQKMKKKMGGRLKPFEAQDRVKQELANFAGGQRDRSMDRLITEQQQNVLVLARRSGKERSSQAVDEIVDKGFSENGSVRFWSKLCLLA